MKKRIVAFILAALMLVSLPAIPGFAAWEQNNQYYSGGDLQYGSAELRCGSSYTTLRFVYGQNVSMGETTLQDIASELGGNDFPVISYPFRYENMGPQDLFIVMSDDADSIDSLIVALEQEAANQADALTSQSDVRPEQPSTPSELTPDEISKIFNLVGLLNFSAREKEASATDVSGSDVSASDVSGSDVSCSDTVQEVTSIEDITESDKDKLLSLLGKLSFGGDDDSSTVTILPADDVSATDVSAADVSAADAEPSDPQDTDENDGTDSDEAPEDAAVSPADVPEEEPAVGAIGSSVDNLLALRSTGIYALEALPTLEESFRAAFPEFYYSAVEKVALEPVISSNVTISKDGSRADVLVVPAAEYVDIELNGKTFTVLLMNQKSTEYTVSCVRLNGNTDRSAITTTTTSATEVTTEATTVTTTTAATTTTTTTTAATTASTTAATTTTTTTTAATTTTTTAPTTAATAPAYTPGQQVTGYVSTRSKRLRVRKGPGLGFATITFIPKGTEVTITGKPNDDWYAVRLKDGTEGYCYSGYITLYTNS